MRRLPIVPANGFRVRPMWLRNWMGDHLDAHWFRAGWNVEGDLSSQPCVYRECSRPGREHWTWCGEWMLPRRQRWSLSLRRLFALYRKSNVS